MYKYHTNTCMMMYPYRRSRGSSRTPITYCTKVGHGSDKETTLELPLDSGGDLDSLCDVAFEARGKFVQPQASNIVR